MQAPHWVLAEKAAREAGVDLRSLGKLEDADRILDVMIATWGRHQLLPSELVRALQESGNLPYGAFRGEDMIGYVLGFLGSDADGLHVHSHMLAVRPGLRSKGIGYALKLAQRAQALDQDVHVARWTFDPLLSRNAHFNFGKLGAHADRFHRHFYGEMTDTLNRDDRSDRLVVRWNLDREPGPRPLPAGEHRVLLTPEGDGGAGRPVRHRDVEMEGVDCLDLRIPRDYPVLRERDPELGMAWRGAVAESFEACFGRGMIAANYQRRESVYHLVPPERAHLDWPER